MTFMEILNSYANVLWHFFQTDLSVFSNVWMYIPLLIPVCFYFIFFLLKWYVLLAPITIPLTFVANTLRGLFSPIDMKEYRRLKKDVEFLKKTQETSLKTISNIIDTDKND